MTTKHDSTMHIRPLLKPRGARGFSLVSAIFLLVALSALAAGMVQLSSVQHASSALDVDGARAYQAARAGIEWGLYQQLNTGTPAPACFTPTSFPMPANSALAGFTVSVACTPEGGVGTIRRWRITARACNRPLGGTVACPENRVINDSYYVQRTMQVDF